MVPFIAVLPSKWSRMGHITAHHWLGGRRCFEVVMLKLGKKWHNTRWCQEAGCWVCDTGKWCWQGRGDSQQWNVGRWSIFADFNAQLYLLIWSNLQDTSALNPAGVIAVEAVCQWGIIALVAHLEKRFAYQVYGTHKIRVKVVFSTSFVLWLCF